MLFIAQIISAGLNFVFIMYISRYLGAESFGILNYALAFAYIFQVFAEFGLSTLTVREVARNKELTGKYLGNILVIKSLIIAIIICIITVIVYFAGYSEQTIRIIYILAFANFLYLFTAIFNSVFQAHEKMEYQSFGNIISGILMVIGAAIALTSGMGLFEIALIYLITNLSVFLYSTITYIYFFRLPRLEVDLKFWKATLRESFPYGLSGIFQTIYGQINMIILVMAGNAAVGWFSAASKICSVYILLPYVFNISLYPLMSRLYVTSNTAFQSVFEQYLKYMAILGMMIGIITMLFADRIILLIYDNSYANSIIVLQILIWWPVLIFFKIVFTQLLESSNAQAIVTKVTGICMVESIILNLLLIPVFSYTGAAIAVVLTELTALILYVIISSKIRCKLSMDNIFNLLKVMVASLLTGVFIILLYNIYILILLPLSLAFYALVLLFLRVFNREDIIILNDLTNRKTAETLSLPEANK